jgi:hypothetical protein
VAGPGRWRSLAPCFRDVNVPARLCGKEPDDDMEQALILRPVRRAGEMAARAVQETCSMGSAGTVRVILSDSSVRCKAA